MRRLPLVLASAALAAIACSSDDPAPTEPPGEQPPPQAVTVTGSANANVFTPASVTVARGGTVTWTMGARPHNATFRGTAGAPADVPTTTNASVSRTFATAGSFPYDCTLHDGMTGTVIVP